MVVAWECDSDHYSPTTSGGHNFRSGTSIDAPFVPTRSLFRPLRFYTTRKCMWLELGWMDDVLGYSMARRKSRVSIELGILIVNVRDDERVVLREVRMVVVRDMYWTGRVGYDNRPGELTLAVGNRHASYAYVWH
ncbi:hypothetical protein PIB30_087346 [Stylosanthes scabra]|uniref:Uncharacterized protein n=1 Tax=Stylosanthes scabra TaxID=79078 RepID=A0ABU6VRV2_9FABA|nr:hypothetical protein [Stylosanthes scabra]